MSHPVFSLYEKLVLRHPRLWLLLLVVISGLAAWQATGFKLDASADSLTLENDKDLTYYRTISKRYGSSDFLIVTYTPREQALFSRPVLEHIAALRDELAAIPQVSSVYSMLDVPLLFSPPVAFKDLADDYRTLESENVDLQEARDEFIHENPLYKDLLVSEDGRTTALLVNLKRDEKYFRLLNRRNDLREKKRAGELSESGREELEQASRAFSDYNSLQQRRTSEMIAEVRQTMAPYRDQARLFLGGVPMIASDMIGFIRSDLKIFGTGVFIFLVLTLFIIFRRPRWVVVPLLCCGTTVLWMTGWLGMVDWKVTVISSNFVSLLLIITMSITIHLIVRYRELHAAHPGADQNWLTRETLIRMARPCIYMVLTTMVAFSSLVISDIKPVKDFGWMMTIGVGVALLLCFLLFPALLRPLAAGAPQKTRDYTRRFTMAFAQLTARRTGLLLLAAGAIAAVSLWGTTQLTVENRFIDYFQKDTEIYQGMLQIDRKLGGTTPVDIVLDAPEGHDQQPSSQGDPFADPFADAPAGATDDPFADPFAGNDVPKNRLEDSYWYTPQKLEQLVAITEYLESLPETGKVLSIATTYQVASKLNGGPLSYVQLMLLSSFVPQDLRERLVSPYLSDDGDQVRISVRVIDSDKNLNRDALLEKIRSDLKADFGLQPEQVHLTGAMVLYNNMLQSLFDSQIKTLGFVFLAVMAMFLILFRSPLIALIAMLPNLFSAAFILGLMGWIGLPLDMMTITIAAITIGIAVDDTIHYIHRFREEFPNGEDYVDTMKRCHGSIGKAMYYTSLTIIAGFSILTLSNFNPTVYFGLLTGLAMLVALVSNLTLLPALLITLKPKVPVLEK
jgi:predicted RND superfamily exporter protein